MPDHSDVRVLLPKCSTREIKRWADELSRVLQAVQCDIITITGTPNYRYVYTHIFYLDHATYYAVPFVRKASRYFNLCYSFASLFFSFKRFLAEPGSVRTQRMTPFGIGEF